MPTIDVVLLVVQAVPALAIGVVGEDVEDRELAEAVLAPFEQREVVLVGIVLDEPLDRALAERAVAEDGDRARRPIRARTTARTPRPRGCTACHLGSPTAAARLGRGLYTAASSSPSTFASTRNVAFDEYRMRPTTSSSAASQRARRAPRGSVPARARCARQGPSACRTAGTADGRLRPLRRRARPWPAPGHGSRRSGRRSPRPRRPSRRIGVGRRTRRTARRPRPRPRARAARAARAPARGRSRGR